MAKPKKGLKAFGKSLINPAIGLKDKLKANKEGFNRMKQKLEPPEITSPEATGPTAEEIALQNRQREQSAMLDREENMRRKRLFSAMSGVRMFRANAARQGRGAGGAGPMPAAAPAAAPTPSYGGDIQLFSGF